MPHDGGGGTNCFMFIDGFIVFTAFEKIILVIFGRLWMIEDIEVGLYIFLNQRKVCESSIQDLRIESHILRAINRGKGVGNSV